MVSHDLRNDLILAFDSLFQFGNPLFALTSGPGPSGLSKGSCAILKEDLLPLVELGGSDVVLFADLRDRNFLQQMKPENLDFVCGTEVPPSVLILGRSIVAHLLFLVWKSILAKSP